jgi:hypothetical protein
MGRMRREGRRAKGRDKERRRDIFLLSETCRVTRKVECEGSEMLHGPHTEY